MITTFDCPSAGTSTDGAGTYAYSINASGVSTGHYYPDDYTAHGVVRAADGTITEFDVPGFETTPLSINNSGAVTGYYAGSDGYPHGFIAAPLMALLTSLLLMLRELH